MSRGQYSLFTSIFEKDKAQAVETTRPRNYFMPLRNEHIAYRWYYWGEIRGLRYDRCLQALEREFYITEARLIVILNGLTEELKQIMEEKPDVKTLRERVPHLNWKSPEAVV